MLPKNIQKLIQVTAGENATDAETVLKSIININLIAFGDNGINDPGCRENIIDFLGRKDLWRSIDKLFIETFGELAGQFEHLTWLQKAEALSGKREKPMIAIIMGFLSDALNYSYSDVDRTALHKH
jgi:hypothetical protein